MKKVTFLTAIALTSLLASACTVTVGEKFDDDDADFSDDPDFVDNSDFDDDSDDNDAATNPTTETDEESTVEETTENESTSTTDTTASDAGENSATDETTSSVDPTTSEDTTSSVDPVNPVSPTVDECEPPGTPYSCAECLHFYCSYEWSSCCGDPTCVPTWNEITTCVADAMSENAIDDVDRCAAMAAPDGDQLNLSEQVGDLMSCVGAEFMGDEDPLGHQPGEGTCTFACYGVESLF